MAKNAVNYSDDVITDHGKLYLAALKGDWKSIENMSDIQREISGNQETTLHVAAAASQEDFVKNLVNILNSEDLAAINSVKNTALTYAALGGNVKIAEMMLEKNADLATLDSGVRPLYMAALSGHSAMAEFLYSKTREEVQKWDEDEQARLFITCVKNDIYGVALEMLKDNNALARASEDSETALHVLARKPSAFYRARQSGMLRRFMSLINISWLNLEREKSTQSQANELLKKCLDNYRNDVEHFREFPEISEALFAAAEVGNIEFLVKLIRFDFSLLSEEENDKRIFHIAVEKRHENIFNLLYEIGPIKDLIVDKKDVGGNNMLHLVARMVPQEKLNAISGAALQMQRELLWFKVEKVVSPTFKEMKNTDGDTPYVLFEKSHRELRKEGEEWMRNTANSSMVVATLIGSIMFSVQPSDELKLNPILLLVYSISSATVLICSTTSLIMFLSILHSRYSYDDFLASLPIKLIIGVIEHMEEDQACLFGDVVLSYFCPKVLIVSTPNYEYNVILQKSSPPSQEEDPDEKTQSQSCKFRNHDHKFEWTREQFNHWATELAAKHNYSVEFSGVGGSADLEPGFASQIAVFRRICPPQGEDHFKNADTEHHYQVLWEWSSSTSSS